jgi:four helix bundle protein
MTEISNPKRYDLEDRTQKFARETIEFIGQVPKTLANIEIAKQLVRSAGSVGANYIEANEALSKKDFVLRVQICRKEAKESKYWLTLLELEKEDLDKRRLLLGNETTELMRIFGAIIEKSIH